LPERIDREALRRHSHAEQWRFIGAIGLFFAAPILIGVIVLEGPWSQTVGWVVGLTGLVWVPASCGGALERQASNSWRGVASRTRLSTWAGNGSPTSNRSTASPIRRTTRRGVSPEHPEAIKKFFETPATRRPTV